MKTKKDNLIKEARAKAEEYFRKGDYFCSESVVTTINQVKEAL